MLYLIIFISTIFLTSRGHLMYENLTGVAQISHYHFIVIIFTFLTACFFASKMLKIFQILPLKHLGCIKFLLSNLYFFQLYIDKNKQYQHIKFQYNH